MEVDRRQKLMDLGAEALADALLDLSVKIDAADDLIERLIASPQKNIQRFKKKLASLKRSTQFVDWRGVVGFARELEMLLQDLEAGVADPLTGITLVAAFYEADAATLGNCDDSSGDVGDVFRMDAKALFAAYAKRCPDKEKVAEIILKLNQKNDYGVRDVLIDCAGDFLPESVIRTMIADLQRLADGEKDEYRRRHPLYLIESLARQIKDARLFEQTRIASWGKLPTAAHIDIARVYLESGDVQTAYSWLNKIPECETFHAHDRDRLLQEIYRRQGNHEKLTELLWQEFRAYHSTDTLQALLDVIGNDKRDEIIPKEVDCILENPTLHLYDAEFLISIGKMDEAERYILERAAHINGEFYGTLLSLAEKMAAENRYLATTLIYRCLLNSILERGYTKAYPHGIQYLKKLDKLAGFVTDWQHFDRHEVYKDRMHQAHSRKQSFWSKYEGRKK